MPTVKRWHGCAVGTESNSNVDEGTQEQITELASLRDIHESRLRELQKKQALFGISTPPETNVEIEHIAATVANITADINRLQIGSNLLLEQVMRAESTHDLVDISWQLSQVGATVKDDFGTLIKLLLNRDNTDQIQRQQRQRITTRFYIAISLLVLVDILVRIFIR